MNLTRLSSVLILLLSSGGILGFALQGGVPRALIKIPPGMRAVSVKVKDVSGIVPGKRVDVLVTTTTRRATVLRNVAVVASEQVEPNIAVVTFLTSPTDADKIMVASQKGQFHLIPHR